MLWQKINYIRNSRELYAWKLLLPISFTLPNEISGKYAFERGIRDRKVRCSCSYRVYAELIANDGSNNMIGRASCLIVIMQRPRFALQSEVEMNLHTQLKTFFCMKNWILKANLFLKNNIVCVNDTLQWNSD